VTFQKSDTRFQMGSWHGCVMVQ